MVIRVGYQRPYCIEPVARQAEPSKILAWVRPLSSPSASLCPPATSRVPSARKVWPEQKSSQTSGLVQVASGTWVNPETGSQSWGSPVCPQSRKRSVDKWETCSPITGLNSGASQRPTEASTPAGALNAAPAAWLASRVRLHASVPLQSPLQPSKV